MELPGEIWWLVAQELTNCGDFETLCSLAQVNRSMANVALPLLYSIHELSPASTGDAAVADTKKWAILWRSILTSCLGGSLYPYCLWIKSLSFGNLHSLLEDLARDQYKAIRTWFFSPPLEQFHIIAGSANRSTRQKRAVMDIESIIIAVADQITRFIKTAANAEDKTVGLTSLEGYHLPAKNLPGWVSRLSLLTSLTVRDGSVLHSEVSEAIRKDCPHFKELVCHYCVGSDVDEGLAGFFNGLAPNTLESFTVMSANRIGALCYEALGRHSMSLKKLVLYVEHSSVQHLPLLCDCRNLTHLTLDVAATLDPEWNRRHEQEVLEITSWLVQCTSLTNLAIINLPDPMSVLSGVLMVPSIKLTDLKVTISSPDWETGPLSALGSQLALESFIFRACDGLIWRKEFIDAICCCKNMRKLELMTSVLGDREWSVIARNLPLLEDFSFDGEALVGTCLRSLSALSHLKTLNIYASTQLSFTDLFDFVLWLVPRHQHQGMAINIFRQAAHCRLSSEEERKIDRMLDRFYGGKLEITYEADYDDLDESDFSDYM